MSWHLLEKILDEVAKQATIVGKIWITCLFMFRIISLTRNAETLYSDEQGAFRCNTRQPGCENMCFNAFSPISHVRFWGFQTIITATPSIMFVIFAAHTVSRLRITKATKKKVRRQRLARLWSERQKRRKRPLTPLWKYRKDLVPRQQTPMHKSEFNSPAFYPQLSERSSTMNNSGYHPHVTEVSYNSVLTCSVIHVGGAAESALESESLATRTRTKRANQARDEIYKDNMLNEIEKILAKAYKAQCIVRIMLEIIFLSIQCTAFGFEVPGFYKCNAYPCPETTDCYISRPGEKSSMLIYMSFVTSLCIILSVYEYFILMKNDDCKISCVSSCSRRKPKPKLDSTKADQTCYFVEALLDRSDDSTETGSTTTEPSDESIDSGELDEMYEQECEMDAGDYEAANEADDY